MPGTRRAENEHRFDARGSAREEPPRPERVSARVDDARPVRREGDRRAAEVRGLKPVHEREGEPHHGNRRGSRRRPQPDRKSTRLNSSHGYISYAVFCLKKKKTKTNTTELFKQRTRV